MDVVFLFVFFAIFQPVLLYTSKEQRQFFKYYEDCPPFHCGKLGELRFPYTNRTSNTCPFVVLGCKEDIQRIQFTRGGNWYDVESISQAEIITITDKDFKSRLNFNPCESFNNLSLPRDIPNTSLQILSNLTLFKCDTAVNLTSHFDYIYQRCKKFNIYYNSNSENRKFPSLPADCSIIQLPANKSGSHNAIFGLLTAKFSLKLIWEDQCFRCQVDGNICQNSRGNFQCIKARGGLNQRARGISLKLGLGLGVPAAIMIISLSIFFFLFRYKRKKASSSLLSGITSSDPSSKSDMEGDITCFGVPIFSYTQLEEATNKFNSQNELGDGGFGTVYYGKLQDGRDVAVKRLYEHNYRRVKQFMNEIEILTGLRHKNLVSIYGCTSRHSRELLLVYEYIPNGTVADHLHGDPAKSGPLSWPVRMRIAIETASALTYLHASDIIHRDVKTNNILLDNSFCVKVADFGLCRLFPGDVTHVSTAPQGTPGYLDPEYHQCYQLTAKSDVYSFGVVLIELISSMRAVDMTRHRHEINLATLAMNKIQKCAFDELIDPYLGHKSDEEIKRMTTSVAELAFLCLQQDKEIRPCMIEVLQELKAIESGGYELENLEQEHGGNDASKDIGPSDSDLAALIKNIQSPQSSNSRTDKWIRSGSTMSSLSS